MKKISSLLTVLALIFALGAFLPEDVLKAQALDDITGLFCDSTNKVLSWNSYDIDAEYRVDIDSNTFTDTRSYTVQDTRFPFGNILSQKGVVYHFTVTAINQDAEAVSNPAKKAYANTTTLTGVEINKDLILSWHPIRGEVEKYRVNLYTPNMQCCFGLETSTGTSVDLTEQLKGAPSGKYSATVEAVVFVDGESVMTGLSDTYKFDYKARSKVIDTTYAIVTEPVAGEHPDETAQLILNGGDFDTEDCVSSCEVNWYEVTVGADSTNYIKPTDVFEADKNYMARVIITLKDGCYINCDLTDLSSVKDTPSSVNGTDVYMHNLNNYTWYSMEAVMTASAPTEYVKNVFVTVDEPIAFRTPNNALVISPDSVYATKRMAKDNMCTWTAADGTEVIHGKTKFKSGLTYTLSFRLAENVTENTKVVVNGFKKAEFVEMDGEYAVFRTEFTAAPILRSGDANGDRVTNLKDGLLMQQFLAGWKVKVKKKNLDVNGDGEVDLKDGILLKQHLAGWNVTLV